VIERTAEEDRVPRTAVNARWNILVVDDEEDVHTITQLALRRQRWLERQFALEHASSAAEARTLLESRPSGHFHVALIDVVMESDTAGLALCRFIRHSQPRHVRLILRTGQAGVAPEDVILNEYDVDHYLAKTDASRDRLYALVRSCLRSGRDIATLSAFAEQLRSFAARHQDLSTSAALWSSVREGLAFLETKYSAPMAFFPSLSDAAGAPLLGGALEDEALDVEAVRAAIRQALSPEVSMGQLHRIAGPEIEGGFVPFAYAHPPGPEDTEDADEETLELGAVYVAPSSPLASDNLVSELTSDVALLLENWQLGYRTLELEDRLSRERRLREQMHFERTQALAKLANNVFFVAVLAAVVVLGAALLF
jgi:CheY-like chemotaxis protein